MCERERAPYFFFFFFAYLFAFYTVHYSLLLSHKRHRNRKINEICFYIFFFAFWKPVSHFYLQSKINFDFTSFFFKSIWYSVTICTTNDTKNVYAVRWRLAKMVIYLILMTFEWNFTACKLIWNAIIRDRLISRNVI